MSIFPTASSEVQSDPWKFNSIGGWLILVAIGICVAPLRQLLFIVKDLLPIFATRTWSVLTTPGSPAYHRLWAPIIIFELLMNVAFIAAEALLIVWLFKRSRLFPKTMIWYLFGAFVLITIDYFMSQAIPAVAAQDDAESRLEFIRSGLACAIWVPYFLKSRRVKGTFTN